jgi:AcrR family transcriptional regulator
MAERKLKRVPARGGGRPAKISPEQILQVARQLGPGEFTFQRIAEKLGVQPPALYYHFASREELLNALAVQLAKEFDLKPGTPKRWKSWLEKTALRFYDFLLANHCLFEVDNWRGLAEFGQPIHEIALETLERAGYSLEQAGRVWEVIGNLTYAEARLITDIRRAGPALGVAPAENPARPMHRTRALIASANLDPRERFAETLHWLVSALPQPRN